VDHELLSSPDASRGTILVGSPAWYTWLESATSFSFRSTQGTFTAHKERRSPTQEYWKAYRRRAGRLRRAYLGMSDELSVERLCEVAARLADNSSKKASATSAVTAEPGQAAPDVGISAGSSHEPDAAQDREAGAVGHASVVADDAESLHLLGTKLLLPPARLSLVPRPQLTSWFEAAIAEGRTLILVAAPAGFGKTTAVTQWLRSPHDRHVAWLALDDADNHLSQFLAYLIAAVETVHPQVGREAWALLRSRAAQPPVRAILTVLLNGLARPTNEMVLTLDDYHTITLQAIHEAVAFLIDNAPSHMHIVMITRADPPLPLARLRARGRLAEMRAADLRFTFDEAIHLFEQLRLASLTPEDVAALGARTEGWPAGLQLAAISLRQQDTTRISTFLEEFTGSHAFVFDYLAEEVFQRLPAHIRLFLMQAAILERLCGPLCAVVTLQDDAQAVLEGLEQANLFLIRLDASRYWYRFHHLFRDFLRVHLERAVSEAERARLYHRASAWFEQQGFVGEAVDYALQAGAWADALRCMTPLMTSERLYEYYLDWPRWLTVLPDDALQEVPDMCLRLGWILTFLGHAEAAERPLALAEAVWNAAGDQPKVGAVLCWRSATLFYRRDFAPAHQMVQQALARLPADAHELRAISSLILGLCDLESGHVGSAMGPLRFAHDTLQHSSDMFFAFSAAYALARAYQLQGKLRRSAISYQALILRAGRMLHRQGPAPYVYLGMVLYEWNDLPAAERTLNEGISVGQQTGRGRYWPLLYAVRAQVLAAQGSAAQATRSMEQALVLSRLLDSERDVAEVQAQQARLWQTQGDAQEAEGWLAAHAPAIEKELKFEHLSVYLTMARIAIAQERQQPGSGDMYGVLRILDQLLQAALSDERRRDAVEILVVMSLAYAARHELERACEALSRALVLAEPEGYVRTFVDEGTSMRTLLMMQREQPPTNEAGKRERQYIDRLLDAFPQDSRPTPIASTGSIILSDREHAVLRLLAAGRAISEIAAQLIISPHTARTHVKNIYAKLDVHSRVQAVERARSLQLL
jgi:LuxR family transcriptional regulator, maltose regulon positive regulatory protein